MLKVLVVEDDKNMNDFMTRVLKSKLGLRVTGVNNGIDAIATLNEEDFDIVFLDVAMPLVDGRETLEIIRSDPRFVDLPVVMVTANKEIDLASKLVKLGITDYILKPVTLDVINGKVREILAKISTYEKPEGSDEYEFPPKAIVAFEDKEILDELKGKVQDDKVIFVSDGLSALKQTLFNRPQVIILSNNLPGINYMILGKTLKKVSRDKKELVYLIQEEEQLSEEEKQIFNSAIILDDDKEGFIKRIVEKIKFIKK